MIPEEIVKFLEGATVGIAATRDSNFVPHVHRVSGWIVGTDRQTITCLVPDQHGETLIPSLEDNAQLALTVVGSTTGPKASRPPTPAVDSHECYQFKGDYIGSRPSSDDDIALVGETRERFKNLYVPLFGFSEAAAAAFKGKPSLALSFTVREIYDQTPGPGAGRRVVPEEG